MDFFRLGVELEGADVEIDLVVRSRRRAVDPAGEARVLETLRQPRAEERRQRFRPAGALKDGQRVRIAHEDAVGGRTRICALNPRAGGGVAAARSNIVGGGPLAHAATASATAPTAANFV